MTHRFETRERLNELDPPATLKKIGLKKGGVLCDIGAGTGIFTIPAARISGNTTYAVDVSDEMLQIMAEKIKAHGLENITLIKPECFSYPIPAGSCDIVLMCASFHHIGCDELLLEISRILKKSGKLAIIEFHKEITPCGPPPERRISRQEVTALTSKNGFSLIGVFRMGENYYLAEYSQL